YSNPGAPGRMQLGRAGGDDGVVFSVDRHDGSRTPRRLQEEAVIVAPLHEPRRDHEDLEPGVPVTNEARDFGAGGGARIGDDHVEREVRKGTLRVSHPSLDAVPQRAILLVDHRDDRRDAAGDRGARAVLEVVEGRKRRRGCEMRVQVDTSGKNEPAARIDLAQRRADIADRADVPAGDRDVGVTLAVRGYDEPAADRELDHAVRRAKRSANAAARPASLTTWIQRSTP